jgi:GTP cyclohydrolase III
VMRCSEPSVDEMLNDPIVRAVMASDGVDLGELQRLLRSIAENLRVRRVEGPQKATSRPTDARNPRRKTETIDAD